MKLITIILVSMDVQGIKRLPPGRNTEYENLLVIVTKTFFICWQKKNTHIGKARNYIEIF